MKVYRKNLDALENWVEKFSESMTLLENISINEIYFQNQNSQIPNLVKYLPNSSTNIKPYGNSF